jgi:TolB-like protein
MPSDLNSSPSHFPGVTHELLTNQGKNIINSPIFVRSNRLKQLFNYLFQETIEGRGDEVTQYTIAYDCLKLTRTFDAAQDSLVRTHIRRLRLALQAYYEGIGKSDPIRVEVSKKGYRLNILSGQTTAKESVFDQEKPTLAVLTFADVELPERWLGFSSVLGDELVYALSGHPQLKVLGPLRMSAQSTAQEKADYALSIGATLLLDGSISQQGEQVVIIARLYTVDGRKQLWVKRLVLKNDLAEVLKVGRIVCKDIGGLVASEHGVIASYFTELAATKPQHKRTVFDAWILGRLALREFSIEHLTRAVQVLEEALQVEPREGLLHATLAILLAVAPTQPGWEEDYDKERVRRHLAEAVRYSPQSPWTRCAMAFYCAVTKDHAGLVALGRSVREDGPVNQTLLGAVGLCLCLQAVESDLGEALIDEAMAMNPHYPLSLTLGKAIKATQYGDLEEISIAINRMELSSYLPPFKGNEEPTNEELAAFPRGGWGIPFLRAYWHGLRGERAPTRFYWNILTYCHGGDVDRMLKRIQHLWSPLNVQRYLTVIAPLLEASSRPSL